MPTITSSSSSSLQSSQCSPPWLSTLLVLTTTITINTIVHLHYHHYLHGATYDWLRRSSRTADCEVIVPGGIRIITKAPLKSDSMIEDYQFANLENLHWPAAQTTISLQIRRTCTGQLQEQKPLWWRSGRPRQLWCPSQGLQK